jgi:hypothetical protein
LKLIDMCYCPLLDEIFELLIVGLKACLELMRYYSLMS